MDILHCISVVSSGSCYCNINLYRATEHAKEHRKWYWTKIKTLRHMRAGERALEFAAQLAYKERQNEAS